VDLSRPVSYRGLDLNDVTKTPSGKLYGNQIDSADYSDVPAQGYLEKRSMADGYDASDIFLGQRRVLLQGTTYGQTRAEAFDRLQRLRWVFTPTTAYDESPAEQGYLPLNFEVPTANEADWPTGYIAQCVRVRPSRQVMFAIRRDQTGGETGLGIQWQAQLDARDPRVYAQMPIDVAEWPRQRNGSGSVCNRGDYPVPLNVLIYAPSTSPAATFKLQIAGSNMVISTPAGALQRVVRYRGGDKVLTVQEGQNENLRMDLLSFTGGTTHPLIQPGDNAYAYQSPDVDIDPETHMWFWESWA
jgi:hypothetical protein